MRLSNSLSETNRIRSSIPKEPPSADSFDKTYANGILIFNIFGYFANPASSESLSFSASNGLWLDMKAPALGFTDSIGLEDGTAGYLCGSFLMTGFFGTAGGLGKFLLGAGGSLGTNPATLPDGF